MAVLLKFSATDDETILDRNLEGNRSAGLERHVRRALGLDLLFFHEHVQLRGLSQISKTLELSPEDVIARDEIPVDRDHHLLGPESDQDFFPGLVLGSLQRRHERSDRGLDARPAARVRYFAFNG